MSGIKIASLEGCLEALSPVLTRPTFTIETSSTLNGDWAVEDEAFAAEEGEDQSIYLDDPIGEGFPEKLFFRATRNEGTIQASGVSRWIAAPAGVM